MCIKWAVWIQLVKICLKHYCMNAHMSNFHLSVMSFECDVIRVWCHQSVLAVPANDQTVDSILVFDLVLSGGAQRVDGHSSFVPADSQQLKPASLWGHVSLCAVHDAPRQLRIKRDQKRRSPKWRNGMKEEPSQSIVIFLEWTSAQEERPEENILTIWRPASGFPPRCRTAWRGSSPTRCEAAGPPGSPASSGTPLRCPPFCTSSLWPGGGSQQGARGETPPRPHSVLSSC